MCKFFGHEINKGLQKRTEKEDTNENEEDTNNDDNDNCNAICCFIFGYKFHQLTIVALLELNYQHLMTLKYLNYFILCFAYRQ
ncbi:hypothetical protein RFI_05136 [Reticulomyxa filosa]|uniref:Uncharacterized protein n=1 Tax=Reticulomyxa filosa TaxID=46433 RepID=X6P095_RETFI|nr:hypothetical protein RFI_05136 [Reticulomyxa filosa]|eukprot:ETO31980.1 hypothetical protein RFI_05136 [Reticulomyxa filosa]